ncbi:MAG: putative peptidoglycan binding domain [Anaerocolumna sp.]|jgi:peptidoglycan hydrolase-like protein with peptidoglycan-binding domain|nr:putative peptidoglycan binding domain [Anaerocolumna sp.]
MKRRNYRVFPAQMETQTFGQLQVNVICEYGNRPVEKAIVEIYRKDDPIKILDSLRTDSSGQTPVIDLPAPDAMYTMEPSTTQPYSEYNLVISVPGLKTVIINGVQILSGVTAIQNAILPRLLTIDEAPMVIDIPPHGLFGAYLIKPYEAPIKDITGFEMRDVNIPSHILVHDGIPKDPSNNFCIEYKDYIKNVVSGTIYATWPKETIYANILTTLSFSLNRYYTNWYKSQGFDFTITSSPVFDNLWSYGRNIYENIDTAVDYIFNYFLSEPNILQPILTQACNGKLVICEGMLSRWGSLTLGNDGYTALEQIRQYLGESIYINSTNDISGVPQTWPGYNLTLGVTGEAVTNMQNQLNTISTAYIAIPALTVNGIYNQEMENAIKEFQNIFYLPETGIIDFATWYKIGEIYTRLNRRVDMCQ